MRFFAQWYYHLHFVPSMCHLPESNFDHDLMMMMLHVVHQCDIGGVSMSAIVTLTLP